MYLFKKPIKSSNLLSGNLFLKNIIVIMIEGTVLIYYCRVSYVNTII